MEGLFHLALPVSLDFRSNFFNGYVIQILVEKIDEMEQYRILYTCSQLYQLYVSSYVRIAS